MIIASPSSSAPWTVGRPGWGGPSAVVRTVVGEIQSDPDESRLRRTLIRRALFRRRGGRRHASERAGTGRRVSGRVGSRLIRVGVHRLAGTASGDGDMGFILGRR